MSEPAQKFGPYKVIRGFKVPTSFEPAPDTKEAKEWFYGGMILPFAVNYLRFQGLDMTVEGAEKIPTTGGAIIVSNHTGYFDFVYDGIPAFLNGKRLVRFMSKQEIFDNKIAGPLMRLMKHIPVDRFAGRGAYEEAVRRLKDGALVGLFPEATISRSFELKSFKTGAVRMANEAGVPVIPIVMFGSQRVWTKGHKKHLGRVKVPVWLRVCDPVIPTDDVAGTNDRLHAEMEKQLDQLKADYLARYGTEPGAYWLPAKLGGSAPTLEEANEIDAQVLEERRAKREARKAAEAEKAAKKKSRKSGLSAARKKVQSATAPLANVVKKANKSEPAQSPQPPIKGDNADV